jgi:hypothetical protein
MTGNILKARNGPASDAGQIQMSRQAALNSPGQPRVALADAVARSDLTSPRPDLRRRPQPLHHELSLQPGQ